jgi:2-dehydropantoate 2-reductase
MDKFDVLIVGTGAMACLFAARLAAAKLRVMMLGTWVEGLQTLRSHGVRVINDERGEQVYSVKVSDDPKACMGAKLILVMVKSWQTEQAGQRLLQCIGPDALVLTLQNGDGNYEKLSRLLGVKRVAVGATTLGATLLGPAIVRPAGDGVITLGIHGQLKPMADLLGKAGFIVDTVPDISSVQWGKLVINAAINPLTALLRVQNGELLHRASARSVMTAAAREAAAVAVAKGVHLPYPDPVLAAEAIARRTASNYSSMLQDILRGAQTEIDFISGAVVQVGEKKGVPVAVNRTLWLLIKAATGR